MDEIKKKRELKAERKRIQEENVKKKQDLKDEQEKKKKGVKFGEEGEEEEEVEDFGDVDIDETQVKRKNEKKVIPKIKDK